MSTLSNSLDIGQPAFAGKTTFDTETQRYTLEGGGYNIWFDRDEFHYAFDTIEGDFILTARFRFVGEGVHPHRKTGWMVRTSDHTSSAHITAALHGDGLTSLQWRNEQEAIMDGNEISAPKSGYKTIQLERTGDLFIMRAAQQGGDLEIIGEKKLELPQSILAGIFICAHQEESIERVSVDNLRIERTVNDDYNPSVSGRLSSRLEIMDIATGSRKIIFENDRGFEAPNWMPDGKRLLFNQEGSLYTIGIDGENMKKLNTGFADRNNNDHGISFDGKTLAISHHRENLPGGGSTIYTLPLEGGEPNLITANTPSYWHGWTADDKAVLYVAKRDEDASYNIFKANVEDQKETQLTFFEGSHVDGPEMSPDGKYIYYNGSQSGTMQIWRMSPDGSENEQLTFDPFNDWFPHISPDNQWVVFLSYPSSIPVNAHPAYKRVALRIMPVSGGTARTIAYLHGGQGTINVPSWAPDSRSIAFVSYTR